MLNASVDYLKDKWLHKSSMNNNCENRWMDCVVKNVSFSKVFAIMNT